VELHLDGIYIREKQTSNNSDKKKTSNNQGHQNLPMPYMVDTSHHPVGLEECPTGPLWQCKALTEPK
jgi:hypothetical protein